MIEPEHLTHHEQTWRLWESMGETPVETRPAEIERRNRPRFLVPDAVCQLDAIGASGGEDIEVIIWDVCADGACLLSPRPLLVRQPITLHPPTTVRTELDAVDGSVIHCRKEPEGHRIGVEFSRT
jgi:hypothetical protein